jgi:hypothetical protein
VAPNGDDVEIHAAGEEEEETTDESPSEGLHCHFHAGVE